MIYWLLALRSGLTDQLAQNDCIFCRLKPLAGFYRLELHHIFPSHCQLSMKQ